MAKTSRPDRRRNSRSKREPKEFAETTLSIDRVTRVVAGGRRLRFRAVVVIGDKKGRVGLGTGKANDVQSAVQKATAVAKQEMIRVPVVNGTIPHEVDIKYKAARIRMVPAAEGTGVIAGGALRVVLEHAGVKNVLTKRFGTTNKLVNAQAALRALQKLRGVPVAPTEEASSKDVTEDEGALEGTEIKEVSKKDVDREGNLAKAK